MRPPRSALDAMLTILPPCWEATIARAVSRVMRKAPRALTLWMRSHSEAVASRKGSRSCSAALFTNNHGTPTVSTMCAHAWVIDVSSARSTATATACFPSAVMAVAWRSASGWSRSARTTVAPASASTCATPRPMPAGPHR